MAPTDGSTVRALGVGSGLMIVGVIAGILGSIVTFRVAALGGFSQTDHGRWIVQYGLQYGLLVLAIAYIGYRGSIEWFLSVKRPTREGIGWVLLAPAALFLFSLVATPILETAGLTFDSAGPMGDPTGSLTQLIVFFVVAWLVAAPSEELLFRGVIQGRLRETLGPASAILTGAVVFALFHVLLGVLDGQSIDVIAGWGVETFVSGALFGTAYERTDNLVIPSVIHATMWTLPYVVPG